MSGIAERIHYCCPVIRNPFIKRYNIYCRDLYILGKGSVSMYTYPDGIFAYMFLPAPAITAMSAGKMTFACYTVADLKVSYTGPDLFNITHIFVSYHHGCSNGFL